MDDHEGSGKVRLDKWLWAARFFKTRSLAVEAIEGGKVHVGGERVKRSKLLQVGDEVRVRLGPYEHQVVVRGLAERRGSAAVAAELYEETPESRERRAALAVQMKATAAEFAYGQGRPTKKERRDIERFRDDRRRG